MMRLLLLVMFLLTAGTARAGGPYMMELPPEVRNYYRNPDGSCVQCSIGMVGMWQNVPEAYTLLWDTPYGPAIRGGSTPSRVAAYSSVRGLAIYNVTGEDTIAWMEWACRTGRFAAIGCGTRHFQTLYGWDPETDTWFICDNNSPTVIRRYTRAELIRAHLASGRWVVILDYPPAPPIPRY